MLELRVLELGSNRIRQVECIENLSKLEELWLGKNKITSMKIPTSLTSLRLVSLQSNRLSEWDESITELPALEELYLGHNKLPAPPAGLLKRVRNLQILDLAGNVVEKLDWLVETPELTDLWLNDNKIAERTEVEHLKSAAKLETVRPKRRYTQIYLERNPFERGLGPAYRGFVLAIRPDLKQLDALRNT